MALSHRVLASWYAQLAQQLDAGVTAAEALRFTTATAPHAANAMAAVVERGGSFDDALRAAARWMPRTDFLTISAAARAGRGPTALRRLAERHARLHTVRQRLILACLYPAALVHLGAFLLPLTRLIDFERGFRWDAATYARGVAALLIPLWLFSIFAIALAKRSPSLAFAVGTKLPAVGRYLRAQALADLAFALSGFIESGVTITDAWAAVATLTRSPRLRRAAQALHATATAGTPPGERLGDWPVFPLDFSVRYRTAEQTGQLDRALADISQDYQQRADRALTFATFLYPAVLFFVVAGAVAFGVFSFYARYLSMLTKMAE